MNDLTPIHPQSNAEVYRTSTDAAGLCKEIVTRTAKNIQGRKYVCVEGWQAIAVAHGCVASADFVERVEDDGCKGFRALGTIRRMSDGVEISRAEGFLGDDETMWAKRPVYARRAMAQTRAISRACRSAFAHVVVLIDSNLSTTPAEEMGWDHPADPERATNVTPSGASMSAPNPDNPPPSVSSGRKSSAQAKRDGDDAKIKADIAKCDRAGLRDWHENFDNYTAHVPLSWLDSIRDMMEMRMEELNGQANVAEAEAELDDSFRGTVGGQGSSRLPRGDSHVAGAQA